MSGFYKKYFCNYTDTNITERITLKNVHNYFGFLLCSKKKIETTIKLLLAKIKTLEIIYGCSLYVATLSCCKLKKSLWNQTC